MRNINPGTWLAYILLLIPTSFALASNQYSASRMSLRKILKKISQGGAQAVLENGNEEVSITRSNLYPTTQSETVITERIVGVRE